jgi:MFS family permease
MNRHVLISLVGAIGMGVAFLNLTPVLPVLQNSYHVNNARMGMLVTALILSHSLVQVPAGLIVDRVGARWSMSLSLGLGFLGNGLCALYYDYYFAFAMRVLAGLGTGLLFVAGIKYATVHSKASRQAFVQSIFGSSINAGSMLPFLISPLLIEFSWRWVFIFTSLFFLAPLTAVIFWGEDQQGDAIAPAQHAGILQSPSVWSLGLSHAIFFGGMMSIGTWISSYLIAFRSGELWLRRAGLIGAVVIGISALGRLLGAFLTRVIKPHKVILLSLLALGPSYVLLGFCGGFSVIIILFILIALLSTVTFGPVFNLTYQIISPASAGRAIGLVNFIACMGALTFPVVFGYLIDLTGSFRYAFLFLSVLSFIALGVSLWLRGVIKAAARGPSLPPD